jgi:HK97 family phage major capsid protein/HK97 family phage prohead protease
LTKPAPERAFLWDKTMNRAYATLELKAIEDNGGKRRFSGIASTPSTDRMGDIVEPKGAKFKLPIPLLWQHDSSDPIGWVTSAKVTDKGIEVEGEIADVPEEGELKARLLKAWQMLQAKLVRGLSIGFNSIESARIDGTYGYKFIKWEWLELSAVTIPANQDASITAIKSADMQLLAALGRSQKQAQQPGVTGKSFTKGKNMKTLKEMRDDRAQKAARMQEILDVVKSEDREMDETEAIEFDDLEMEVKQLDVEIREARLNALNAGSAKEVDGRSTKGATGSRGPTIIIRGSEQEEKFKGQNYTRMVIAKALAHLEGSGVTASGIALARWGKSNPMLAQILKANEVAGGGSGSGEWGAELVTADNRYTGDFIEYLTSKTVYDKLPLRQIPANVTIKGQDGTATGYWVGESKPIPVSKADFSSVSLTPLKVAALAVVSNELLRDSSPAAEMLVRDALVDASSQRIDNTFLSAAAASNGVSPAGILNGVVGKASTGADASGVRGDIKQLYRDFITNKNADGLQLVMHPAQAKAISLMVNALGQTEFPGLGAMGGTLLGDTVVTGDNVDGGHVILLKPSDIYRIGDSGVQVSVSREAAIEQNSVPTGATDTPVGVSQAWTSMFQSESTAIKVVRSINFAKRRSSAVQYVYNADYDGVES